MLKTLFSTALIGITLLTACDSISSEPYVLEDQPSQMRLLFPGYPYNQAVQENPYRRMVELKQDSAAFWLTVTKLSEPFSEELRNKVCEELDAKMKAEQFEQISRIDSTYQSYPSCFVYYRKNDEQIYNQIIFRDSFLINPSVLVIHPSQYGEVDEYLGSLNFFEP